MMITVRQTELGREGYDVSTSLPWLSGEHMFVFPGAYYVSHRVSEYVTFQRMNCKFLEGNAPNGIQGVPDNRNSLLLV